MKDSSLEYDAECDRDELVRRYAERCGLDPLHPFSEIVVAAALRPSARRSTDMKPALATAFWANSVA